MAAPWCVITGPSSQVEVGAYNQHARSMLRQAQRMLAWHNALGRCLALEAQHHDAPSKVPEHCAQSVSVLSWSRSAQAWRPEHHSWSILALPRYRSAQASPPSIALRASRQASCRTSMALRAINTSTSLCVVLLRFQGAQVSRVVGVPFC